MIANTSRRVILLADYSKFDYISNFVSVSLDCIDTIVTDNKAPLSTVEVLRQRGIEVYIA